MVLEALCRSKAHGELLDLWNQAKSSRIYSYSLGNFMLDLDLTSSGTPWVWIQSPLVFHAIPGGEAVSHHLSSIIPKGPLMVWKESDSWKLLEGLCGHPLASSFCCEKKILIGFTTVYRSVHQGSLGRVIFTFRSIFSFWIMGWWGDKWSWLLMILKSLQTE